MTVEPMQLDAPRTKRRWAGGKLTLGGLALGLVALGLLWRAVRYALGFPIWGDEAFVAVNFVGTDYADLLRPLRYGQIAPLLYMWAELAISRALGLSEWSLRLLATLAGITALLLFWRFAHTVLPRPAALLATGLLAAGYYVVRHGAEVKPYATDLLVSLGLTMLAWAVWRGTVRPATSPRADGGRHTPRAAWAGLLALAAAAPWLSYPAVFVAGGVGLFLTLLVHRSRQAEVVIGWALFGTLLCGSFGVMWVTYAQPHAAAAARLTEISMWTMAFPPWHAPWKLPGWLVLIHTGMLFAYPHGGHAGGGAVTFVLFLLGCVRMWRKNRPLLVLLLAPFVLTFIAASFQKYPYGGSVRTSLYLAPAICLLAGSGAWSTIRHLTLLLVKSQRSRGGVWARERGFHFRNGLLAACVALAALQIGVLISDVARPYQSNSSLRSKEAVLAVARESTPADRWVIFNATERVPHAPYLGDWAGVGGQFVFDALRFAPGEIVWSPPPEQVTGSPAGRTWLLAYRAHNKPKNVAFPEAQLESYVSTLAARLGPPTHQSHAVKQEKNKPDALKDETIEVYRFEAAAPIAPAQVEASASVARAIGNPPLARAGT